MLKFSSTFNYAAEAMLNFFFIKTTKTIDTSSTVGKSSGKLNYASEAMLNFFLEIQQKLLIPVVLWASLAVN